MKPDSEISERTRGLGRAHNLRRRGVVGLPHGVPLLPPIAHACDICRSDDPGSQDWNADHDHDTGILRGWLCNRCNLGLGKLKDSPVNAAAALVYLAAHGKALSTEDLVDFLAAYQRALPTPTQEAA